MKKDKMFIIAIVAILAIGVVCLCMTVFSNKGNEPIKVEPTPSTGGEPTVVGGYSLEGAVAGTLPENAKKAYDEATANLTGVSYKPLCCLGTQVVAGTNYAILATSKAVVPNAQEKLVVLFIYDALNDNAKITSVEDFALLDYIDSSMETVQAVEPNEQLAGGWHTPEEGGMNAMPQRLASTLPFLSTNDVMPFMPLACVATQVVAGTNYALVCRGQKTYEGAVAATYMVVLYDGVDGTRQILSVMPINVPDLRTNA